MALYVHTEELGQIQWRLIVLTQLDGGLGITVESTPNPARSPGRDLALELDDEE